MVPPGRRTRRLPPGKRGVGNHGENEVEHDGVETGIRKGKRWTSPRTESKRSPSNARSSPRQHRGSDVAAHVTVPEGSRGPGRFRRLPGGRLPVWLADRQDCRCEAPAKRGRPQCRKSGR